MRETELEKLGFSHFFDEELSPSQVGFELKKWFLKEF